MKQLRFVNEFMYGKRKLFSLAMVLTVVSTMLYFIYPFLTRVLVDDVLVGKANVEGEIVHNFSLLVPILIAIIVSQVIKNVVKYGVIVASEDVSQTVLQRMRTAIYAHLSELDVSFYNEYRTGDLMTRLTADMDRIRHTIAWIAYNVLESVCLFLFTIIYYFTLEPKLALIMLLITPIIFLPAFFYAKTAHKLFGKVREKLSKMNTIAQENISGNKTIKAFAQEVYECEKFAKASGEFRDANIDASLYWLKFWPIIDVFSQSLGTIAILVGGIFIIGDKMSFGALTAISLLTWGISSPIANMGMYINDMQHFFVSVDKIMEVYYAPVKITNLKKPYKPTSRPKGDIVFENVSYKYNCDKKSKYSVENINLSIKSGETVAIMGATGSGKTTVLNMIPRLLDPQEGTIFVDGVDVKKWDMQELRKCIGYATQDVVLYSNSVDANIAYGNPDLDEETVKTCAALAAGQFIEKLSDGYETIIGERGTGLSGGQKQRIALARAIAVKPSILILDDTTSAVDNETEEYIQNSLNNLPFECTKVIVAQRISSVQNADKIVIMENGKILEMGKHEELIENKAYYYEICKLQGYV